MAQEQKTPFPVSFLAPLFVFVLVTLPTFAAVAPIFLVESTPLRLAAIALMPVIYCASFVGFAAALSYPFQKAIVQGKFPRDVTHVIYGPRKLYGLCWGAVYYFTPVYYAFMSVPLLKKILLKSFGYVSDLDAVIAPDAWLRDLPMLRFKKGSYVANKATIGTNMCLSDGSIIVDRVGLGEGAMIGHMTMIAPGCRIGNKTEIGGSAVIGIRVQMGIESRVGPRCGVNHGVLIGNGVSVGAMSYIGVKAKIGDGVEIPSGASIPEGAELNSKEDAAKYFNSETQYLKNHLSAVEDIYISRIAGLTLGGPDPTRKMGDSR